MVKYVMDGDYSNKYYLNCISNELAELVSAQKDGNAQAKEANRLKRCEIINYCAAHEIDVRDAEKEDRA